MSSRILMMAGVLLVAGGGGAIGLALGSDGGMGRLSETYLVSFAYFLSLALGAGQAGSLTLPFRSCRANAC